MLTEMERHRRISRRVTAGFALQLFFILFRRASWLVCRKQIRKQSKVVLGTNEECTVRVGMKDESTLDWLLAVEVKKKDMVFSSYCLYLGSLSSYLLCKNPMYSSWLSCPSFVICSPVHGLCWVFFYSAAQSIKWLVTYCTWLFMSDLVVGRIWPSQISTSTS